MAGETLSQGTILRVQSNDPPASPTYVVVGGVEGFTLPGIAREDIEVTALDSTAREFIGDLPDTGESSFTLMLRRGTTGTDYAAGQQRLEALAISGTVVNFQVDLPATATTTAARYTVQGYVKAFQVTAQVRDALKANCTIKFTGAPTKGAAA